MKRITAPLFAAAALAALVGAASLTVPASAQTNPQWVATATTPGVNWHQIWDTDNYDQQHVVVGRVTNFGGYRLTVVHRNGMKQTVDLKGGTFIYPTGATPTQGERVAMLGYYSNGTFIVNEVVIKPT